jgi:hypothetical protein
MRSFKIFGISLLVVFVFCTTENQITKPLSWINAQSLFANTMFFGPEQWEYFEEYIVEQTARMTEIQEFPWSEMVLNSECPFEQGKKIRETHFAFLGIDSLEYIECPVSIRGLWDFNFSSPGVPPPNIFKYYKDLWYYKESFAFKKLSFRWYLIYLKYIRNSVNQTYNQQLQLLPVEYEVPTAIELVSMHCLDRELNEKFYPHLESQFWYRCNDYTADGQQVALSSEHVTYSGAYYKLVLAKIPSDST